MQYQEIENLFSSLFGLLSGALSEADMAQVRLFVGAGEYGIAFETLMDSLDEQMIEKSPSMGSRIDRLRELMGI